MNKTTEEEFDELWGVPDDGGQFLFTKEDIKAFISQKLTEQEARVKKEMLENTRVDVEKYRVNRQVGNMAGDYIFIYDLEKFVLSKQ